jgi:hypothetical protein
MVSPKYPQYVLIDCGADDRGRLRVDYVCKCDTHDEVEAAVALAIGEYLGARVTDNPCAWQQSEAVSLPELRVTFDSRNRYRRRTI